MATICVRTTCFECSFGTDRWEWVLVSNMSWDLQGRDENEQIDWNVFFALRGDAVGNEWLLVLACRENGVADVM